MSDALTPAMLNEFREMVREASQIAYSNDSYLGLLFAAALNLARDHKKTENPATRTEAMMDHVILFRNTTNGVVGFVGESEDGDRMAIFPDRDAAIAAASMVPILRAYPWQIVELNEI